MIKTKGNFIFVSSVVDSFTEEGRFGKGVAPELILNTQKVFFNAQQFFPFVKQRICLAIQLF
jgi:hypothetical protein